MDWYDLMKFKCKLCGDIVFSHYFGHKNQCKCGNLVMQEDPDTYDISTNIEDTSEFVLLDFDELELEHLSREDLNFFEKTNDAVFDENSDFPF